MFRLGSALFLILLACAFAAAQSASTPSATETSVTSSATVTTAPAQTSEGAPPAATLSDVIERVVQREHYFMSQMRHMHPLVETYLQNLKSGADGTATPVKDEYFL